MKNSYFVYHLHSDYSSCITNIDSATKIDMYINKAQEIGMKALAFSEHGSILNWYEKKSKIESAGMKYVHAAEVYLTESIREKIRDNYHCVLIAKNFEGFKELNKLISHSFNRNDNHFYYVPRITFEELMNTSDNIIITTACLASVLCKGEDNLKDRFLGWMINHSDRCFLEIQHHNVEKQKGYNRYLLDLHKKTGLRLITGTDTHSLNKELAEARVILQRAKNTYFSDEEGWDLTFKTYDELVESYKIQNSIPMEYVLDAINNTNVLEEMIEPFEIDTQPKYPKLYENSINIFRKLVYDSIDIHPYALKNHSREEIIQRVEEELLVYEATNMIDFMLFQKFVRDWEHEHDIFTGPARGSVSGSFIAYLLQITDMDSIKFNLNFFRFANKDRVSNADIDSDYFDPDRVKVRNFLLTYPKIKSAEIVAFSTIKLKGAIRDVGRALNIPLNTIGNICKRILVNDKKEDYAPDDLRNEYPELFKFVDLLNGVITSVGTHPAGVLCASRDIEEEIGLFTLSTTEYPVSCLDMYGLDAGWWTKLDCLGLDNVGIINETCKLAGIERLTPDNTNLDDWEVWKDIREDTTCIFQFESSFAGQTMKQVFSDKIIAKIKTELPNISYLKLMSFVNALIRPCGASVREKVIAGEIHKTGIFDIDDMLSAELGNCIIQEDIMNFLIKFCGYTLLEADKARKCIAKKKGTENLLPAIKNGFIEHSKEKYNLSDNEVDEIINPILKCILDATRYAFSWNHSDAYSFIGYACGYLRHYYPLEFITTCLNIWQDKEEKTANVILYAGRHGYKIKEPQFRYSKSDYFFNRDTNTIYKGMRSIKHLNEQCSNELYNLRNNTYDSFIELLYDLKNININSRQIDILIKLNYFKEFGNPKELLQIYKMFQFFKDGNAKLLNKETVYNDEVLYNIVKRYANETDKLFNKLNVNEILNECEAYIKCQRLSDFSWKEKIVIQQEYLGYINLFTGEEKDRPKLIILKKQTLISKIGKNKGKPWCVMVQTQSIGSNIKGSFTIPFNIYSKEPFNEMDVIYCNKWERRKGYNYMLEYYRIF